MFSLRSKPSPAGFASALTIFLAALALLALPAIASAAPQEGEGESPPAPPQLALEPGSYDFGLIEAGRSSGETTMQLRNVGSVPAPINATEITGSGAWAFSTGNSSCFLHPLEPGEACYVQVSFHPQDSTPYTAQLRAVSDGGVYATADLGGEGGRARLAVATDPTNFGSVPVGSGGVIRTIDVSNEGNMPGGVFIAVIAGGAVGSFHLLDESCTGVMLTPDAVCNLEISFEPVGTGVKTARVLLVGDGDGGTQITLSGVGLSAPQQGAGSPQASTPEAQAQLQPRRRHRRRGQRRRGAVKVAVAARRALH